MGEDAGGTGSGFESPLDDLFVDGARYREPSAAEREREAREFRKQGKAAARRNKRTRRRGRARKLVPWLVLAALVGGYMFVTRNQNDAAQVSLPSEIRVISATPSDVAADPAFPAAIAHEMQLADEWLADQSGGKHLNFVDDEITVETRVLNITAAELEERGDAAGLVRDEVLGSEEPDPDEVVVVFVPVTFEHLARCGEAAGAGLAVMWIGTCDMVPSTTSVWGSLTAEVVTHELLHTMGAVDSCAPHYGQNGHVVDDPNDIMYDGPDPRTGDVVLDPGHDDYYDHGIDDCADTKDSPLWG